MLNTRLQGDGFHEALARFKIAPSFSYLAIAWNSGSKAVNPSSLSRINSVSTSRPGQKKTTHTVISEGKLVNLDMKPLKQYLTKGLTFHIFLKVKEDIVMIQQIGGVGTGGMQRKRVQLAAVSISALVTNIAFTVTVTHPDQLTRALLQSTVGYSIPTNVPNQSHSSSSSPDMSLKTIKEDPAADVPICVTADMNSPILGLNLGKGSSSWTTSGSPPRKVKKQSNGKTLLPIMLDSDSPNKRISTISLYETADAKYHDCASSTESLNDDKEEELAQPTTVLQAAFQDLIKTATSFPLKEINTNKSSLQTPFFMSAPDSGLQFSTSIQPQSDNSWSMEKSKKVTCSPQRQQTTIFTMTPRGKAKREQVLKRLTEEQNSWDDDIPSYYEAEVGNDGARERGPSANTSTASLKQRGGKKLLVRPSPIAPPPLGPLPVSPEPLSGSTVCNPASTPGKIIGSSSTLIKTNKSTRSPRVDTASCNLVQRDACLSPIITLGGHVKSPFRSNSMASSRYSEKEREEDRKLQEMPPFMASIEIARRNTKKMQSSDLDGETWLTRVQRQRSQSEAVSMGMPSSPGRAPSGSESPAINSMEALQARQRALYFQLSEFQRRQRDLEESERLLRNKWVGEESYRQNLNVFDRSTREAEERKRKQYMEELRRENVVKMEALQRQLRELKEMMEDGANYKNKLQWVRNSRHARMTSAEKSRQDKHEQDQIKYKANAERRTNLRVEVQASTALVMARGSITVQSDDGVKRKRRRYELHRKCLFFFSETSSSRIRSIGGSADPPLAKIAIEPGCIISIRNAFEDFQAPYSFCLQYFNKKQGKQSGLMACTDTEEEKERLLISLSLLSYYNLKDSTFER